MSGDKRVGWTPQWPFSLCKSLMRDVAQVIINEGEKS